MGSFGLHLKHWRHVRGLAPRIADFPRYSAQLPGRLQADALRTGSAELEALLEELGTYPGVDLQAAPAQDDGRAIFESASRKAGASSARPPMRSAMEAATERKVERVMQPTVTHRRRARRFPPRSSRRRQERARSRHRAIHVRMRDAAADDVLFMAAGPPDGGDGAGSER
jgi:hypothetical protein